MELIANRSPVTFDREAIDTDILYSLIRRDKWISKGTIIVNCFPEYSSRLAQSLNHALSHLNSNELFEVVNLNVPTSTNSQVWNPHTLSFEGFDTYLRDWVRVNVPPNPPNYLFIGILSTKGRTLSKIRSAVRLSLDNSQFRFACLYTEDSSTFQPDYFVRSTNPEKGKVLFQWENINNPEWDL